MCVSVLCLFLPAEVEAFRWWLQTEASWSGGKGVDDTDPASGGNGGTVCFFLFPRFNLTKKRPFLAWSGNVPRELLEGRCCISLGKLALDNSQKARFWYGSFQVFVSRGLLWSFHSNVLHCICHVPTYSGLLSQKNCAYFVHIWNCAYFEHILTW